MLKSLTVSMLAAAMLLVAVSPAWAPEIFVSCDGWWDCLDDTAQALIIVGALGAVTAIVVSLIVVRGRK